MGEVRKMCYEVKRNGIVRCMEKKKLFSVVYRSGGKESCLWRELADRFKERRFASLAQCEVERMGYKALVFLSSELDAIGLPEGWGNDDRNPLEIARDANREIDKHRNACGCLHNSCL